MMNVANTIKDQLGHKALYMLGASQLVGGESFLQFAIKGSRACNKVRIDLDVASDTYIVSFWKIGRGQCRPVASVSDVYVDSLHAVLEKHTGLYTSL